MSNQPPPDPYGRQPGTGDQFGQTPQPSSGAGYPGQPAYPAPGQQPAYPSGPPAPIAPTKSTNSLAIVSLVCSLAGLFIWISAPVGAILGHVARKQIRERGEQGDGLALGGIIAGWVITGLGLLGCCGIIAAIVLTESA